MFELTPSTCLKKQMQLTKPHQHARLLISTDHHCACPKAWHSYRKNHWLACYSSRTLLFQWHPKANKSSQQITSVLVPDFDGLVKRTSGRQISGVKRDWYSNFTMIGGIPKQISIVLVPDIDSLIVRATDTEFGTWFLWVWVWCLVFLGV